MNIVRNTKSKIKKPLIIVTFIIMTWLSSIEKVKEIFHVNGELKKAFDEGGLAANYAQYAYIIALMTGSFVVVLLINTLFIRSFRKIVFNLILIVNLMSIFKY